MNFVLKVMMTHYIYQARKQKGGGTQQKIPICIVSSNCGKKNASNIEVDMIMTNSNPKISFTEDVSFFASFFKIGIRKNKAKRCPIDASSLDVRYFHTNH